VAPARGPDAHAGGPTRRIARRKRFFQAFIDIALGDRTLPRLGLRGREALALFMLRAPGWRTARSGRWIGHVSVPAFITSHCAPMAQREVELEPQRVKPLARSPIGSRFAQSDSDLDVLLFDLLSREPQRAQTRSLVQLGLLPCHVFGHPHRHGLAGCDGAEHSLRTGFYGL